MRLRYKLLGLLALAASILLSLRGCLSPDSTMPIERTTLRSNETSRVTVTPTRVSVQKRTVENKIDTQNVPTYGHGSTIIQDDKGRMVITPKVMGFSYDFGLSTDMHNLGVAQELGYYKRVTLMVGSNFIDLSDGSLRLDLFLAIGYRLPHKKLNNISPYVGYSTDQKVIGGLFLRFGNS